MTFNEAVDAMMAVFKTVWGVRPAVYPDVPGSVTPTDTVLWARIKIKHATGRQGSLTGGLGTTCWERTGFVWIEVYSPVGDGLNTGRDAAQEFVNAYQDQRSGIWYRNIRMVEMGTDGAFERFDVKADFEYRDVR